MFVLAYSCYSNVLNNSNKKKKERIFTKRHVSFLCRLIALRKYKIICTPCENSDQPLHSCSLIKSFTGTAGSQESKTSSGGITKTYLYNFDPLKLHFYIVKWVCRVYIIFLISAQNIDCGYSLEPPRRGGSNEYPQSMF